EAAPDRNIRPLNLMSPTGRRESSRSGRLDLPRQLDKNACLNLTAARPTACRGPSATSFPWQLDAPVFDQIEKLKQDFTDKFVVVDATVPELKRFDGHIGQIKTIN